jgi:phospholipase C
VAGTGQAYFDFTRFGVRVPTILVSSYVEPGTVFRSAPGETPYDHTSILATLRDWPFLGLDKTKFLPSPRIAAAPTLDRVLSRAQGNENANWPDIIARCQIDGADESPDTALNSVQHSLLAAAKAYAAADKLPDSASTADQVTTYKATLAQSAGEAKSLTTYNAAVSYLHPNAR